MANKHPIEFFNNEEIHILASYAGVKKIQDNEVHTTMYNRLAHTYEKVEYWARKIQEEVFPDGRIKIIKKPTNQANNFEEYLWAKIYPSKESPSELAYTLEINANHHFIVKIDTVGLKDYDPTRLAYLKYRQDFQNSNIVKLLYANNFIEGGWDLLISTTIDQIRSLENHYKQLLSIFLPTNVKATIKVHDKNYWLACYNFKRWPKVFRYNETYWFHEVDLPEIPQLIRENLKKARVGDFIVGLPNRLDANCKCIFQITRDLHYSKRFEANIIEFRPIFISEKGFRSDIIVTKTISYGSPPVTERQVGFFEIERSIFLNVLSLFEINENQLTRTEPETILTSLTNDIDHDTVLDQLDFEPDINALASLISYKNIPPPLAIGLFGNWGTGKSYFMHHLAKKILEFSKLDENTFCSNTIEIHFNSWHYIDTNLWASLVNHIFNSINKYFKKVTGDGESEIIKLYNSFNSVKQLKLKKENEKNLIQGKIEDLSTQLKNLRGEKKGEIDKLNIPITDIAENLFEDEMIQKKINDLKTITLGPNLQSVEVIESQINQLQSFTGKFTQAVRNIKTYSTKEIFFYIVIPILIFVAPIAVGIALKDYFPGWYQFLSSYFTKIIALLSASLVFLSPVNKVLNKFEDLHNSLKKLKHQKLLEKSEKELKAERILEEYKIREDLLNNELIQLTIQKSEIDKQIKEVQSGKRIYNWISEKAGSNDYKQHLGLISTIREDFEMLDALMADQDKARELVIDGEKPEEINVKIDRIVLFIDDLDRCPEDRVIQVLQAVHLLMAFKLFVVVVGVDSRWLKNAIESHYKKEMGATSNNAHPLNANDYLEKIFQVTFKLRDLSEDSSKKYLNYLTRPKNETANQATQSTEIEKMLDDDAHKIDVQDVRPISEREVGPLAGTTISDVTQLSSPTKIIPSELELIDREIEFMEEISLIISNSPRTIKRFVNMYRILRVHNDFKYLNPTDKHKEVAILLLALTVGGHFKHNSWLERILNCTKDISFKELGNLPEILNGIKLATLDYKIQEYMSVCLLVDRFGFNDN